MIKFQFNYILFLVYIILSSPFTVLADDNTPSSSTELNEVVVFSKNAWKEGDKYIYVPTRRERNFSTSPSSLIERMHINQLQVLDGKIKTRAGQEVNIFINGIPADDIDLSSFWPKNAIRVEFMENSADPKFQGKVNVLNFVMTDYEYGGLTRINFSQKVPNEGSYKASSKFVYKKMTYGMFFNGGYKREHSASSVDKTLYDDIYYNDVFYKNITQNSENNDIANRMDGVAGGFNARYRNKTFTATHGVQLNWNRNPGSHSSGYVDYDPSLFDSNLWKQEERSRMISPLIYGNYQYDKNKLNISGGWQYNYSYTNLNSSYEENNNVFENGTKEKINAGMAWFIIGYRLNLKHYLKFNFSEFRNYYNSVYRGTCDTRTKQNRGTTNMSLYWWYMITDKLYLAVTPQLNIYDWNIDNSIKKTQWIPSGTIDLSFRINEKNSLYFNSFYTVSSPSAAESNNLTIRKSELEWIKGNPYLKTSDRLVFALNYNLFLNDNLRFNALGSYFLYRNEMISRYISGGLDYDGVIKNTINAKPYGFAELQINGTWMFCNRKFTITPDISYRQYHSSGYYKSLNSIRPRLSVSAYLGNFEIRGTYYGRSKYLSLGGDMKTVYPQSYSLSLAYAIDNLNISCNINELFSKHYISKSTLYSGGITKTSKEYNIGRSAYITLTYTFDYGKKLTPEIEINEQSTIESGILK